MRKGQESRQKAVFDERIDTTYQSLDQLSELNEQLDKNKSAIDQARLQPSKSAVEATSKILLPEAISTDAIARSNKYRAEAELSAKSARTLAGAIFQRNDAAQFGSMALSYATSLTVLNRVQQYIALSESRLLSQINSIDQSELNKPNESNISIKENIDTLMRELTTIHQEIRDECVKRYDIVAQKNVAEIEGNKREIKKIQSAEETHQKHSVIFNKNENVFSKLIEGHSNAVISGIEKKINASLKKGDTLSAIRLLQSLHQSISELQQSLPRSFIDINTVHSQNETDRNTLSRYTFDINNHFTYLKSIMDKDDPLIKILENSDPNHKSSDAKTMEALEKKIKSLDESINNTTDQNEKDRLTTLKKAVKDYKTMYEDATNLRDKEGWAIGKEYIQIYNVSKDDIENKKYFSGHFDIDNRNDYETLSAQTNQMPVANIFNKGSEEIEKESEAAINSETLRYVIENHGQEMTALIQPTLRAHFENKLTQDKQQEWEKTMPLLKSVAKNLTEALKKLDREGDITQLSDDELRGIIKGAIKNKSQDSTLINSILDNEGVSILRNAINKFDEKKGNVESTLFSDLEGKWNASKNSENERKLDDLLGGKNTIHDLTNTERALVGAKVSESIIQKNELSINQEKTTNTPEGKKTSHIALDARFRVALCRNIAAKADSVLQTLRGNAPINQNVTQQQASPTQQSKQADSPPQAAMASAPAPSVPPIPKNFVPKWAQKNNEGKPVKLVTPGKPEATRQIVIGQSWTQKSSRLQNPPTPDEAPKQGPKK